MARRLGERLGDPRVARRSPTGSSALDRRPRGPGRATAWSAWRGSRRTAERAGLESTGVTAFRDAAVAAAIAMDYRARQHAGSTGLRYADSIEQSYCAHLMTATTGDGRVGRAADWAEAAREAAQAIADHGCRRGAELARWALGVRRDGPRRPRRGRTTN